MTFQNWITNGTTAPFYARKHFSIFKEVKRAEAKVCGLGQFVFWLNGQKVGDHELDPGWTNYRKLIQYVAFDVTGYLRRGRNVLGAEVGNGWFIKMDEHYTFAFPPFMPPNPNPYRPFGRSLVLALELAVTYADGTQEVITADESFQVKEHPVIMSNVYGSETWDGSLVQKGWSTVDFDAGRWAAATVVPAEDAPKGVLTEQLQPAVKTIKTYAGKLVGTVNGRDIYDFGQNMSGILELELRGRAGDAVKLYPAEKLGPGGDVDQMAKGWLPVDSCTTCILGTDGEWESYRMKFTYFAGRFAAVERGSAEIRNFKAHAITSAWKTSGSFTCDDQRYNRIYDMIERAVEANMLSVHTDCPTIERFAWQEPNHLMAPAIFYMKDGRKLWEKFLLDIRTEQHTGSDRFRDYAGNEFCPGDGLVPSQAPCYIPNAIPVPGMGSFYDIIPWGSTSILGVYWHYRFYGDKKIIEDNYDCGMRYLSYLKTKVNKDGFINHGLGDWGNPRNELARENIETAFLYADITVLAQFADILGKPEDQAELEAYAEGIKRNYNEKLLIKHPTEDFWGYRSWDCPDEVFLTQASQALPLYWGLVPEEHREDVVRALRRTLERDGAFICGEVGLPYVIQTAREYGMNDLIAKFVTRTEHPSYYAFVLDGETTLGEYWENNPRSHCHDMMGHIIEWYYNGIAGIQPQEPGFGKVVIRPYLPEGMTEFDCAYRSVKGEIRVQVKQEGNEVRLSVTAPKAVDCTIDDSNLRLGLSAGRQIIVKQGSETDKSIYAVVGVNGAGGISDIYLKNMIHRFPTLKVKGVCSRKLENARRKAEQYGIQAMTWDEMLADPEITMIVNLTPADAHFQVIQEALRAGKHVFTEKILAETREEGRRLCELADAKGLYLGSAPETFMGSAVQTARTALESGRIGDVASFHIQANRDLDFLTSFVRFLRAPGGGIGKDYGVYYLTALLSLLGPVKRVMGLAKNPRPARKNIIPDHPEYGQEYAITDETQLYGVLELASGVCGTIHLNGDSITQDEGGITLYGDRGHLLLPCPNHMGGEVRLVLDNSPVWDQRAQPEVLENHFFFQDNARGMGPADLALAIRRGERPRVSKEMACHALEVFEAMYESSRIGKWIEVCSVFEQPRPMPCVDAVGGETECFV